MIDIDLNEIISNFEKTMGLSLEFSEDNIAEVIFNKDIAIGIKCIDEDGTITLSSVISDDLPDPMSKDLLQEILKINSVPVFTYGGNNPVIARDPNTGFIFVYEIITSSVLQVENLFNIFSDFVRSALVLREYITSNSTQNKELQNINTMIEA
ncbi:MAG: CesT family type III secretion system chaperone [Desulfovibrionaceae bacterium]|nr:CesT family type III secretion system chaperone [Desulfovibrionaceae bacterium]